MTTQTATKDEIIEAYLGNNRRNWITDGEEPREVATKLVTLLGPAEGLTDVETIEILQGAIEAHVRQQVADLETLSERVGAGGMRWVDANDYLWLVQHIPQPWPGPGESTTIEVLGYRLTFRRSPQTWKLLLTNCDPITE